MAPREKECMIAEVQNGQMSIERKGERKTENLFLFGLHCYLRL